MLNEIHASQVQQSFESTTQGTKRRKTYKVQVLRYSTGTGMANLQYSTGKPGKVSFLFLKNTSKLSCVRCDVGALALGAKFSGRSFQMQERSLLP